MTDPVQTVIRRIETLDDEDVLRLHRYVCRRAALIYGPRFMEKRDAHHKIAMAFQRPPARRV